MRLISKKIHRKEIKIININKTLTYVKWIVGCVMKPWEMAVFQGFCFGRDYGEIS